MLPIPVVTLGLLIVLAMTEGWYPLLSINLVIAAAIIPLPCALQLPTPCAMLKLKSEARLSLLLLISSVILVVS